MDTPSSFAPTPQEEALRGALRKGLGGEKSSWSSGFENTPAKPVHAARSCSFLQALLEVGEAHDREVQNLREELRALQCEGAGVHVKPRQEDLDFQEACQPKHTWRQQPARALPSSLYSVQGAPSLYAVQGASSNKSSVQAMVSRSSTYSPDRVEKQLLAEDLALVQGWHELKTANESRSTLPGVLTTWHCGFCYAVVNHHFFDAVCSGVIIANAVLMGVIVDWLVKNPAAEEMPMELEVGDRLFTCWFFLELLLRCLAHGAAFFYRGDRAWNVFDFVVVACDVLMTVTTVQKSGVNTASSANVSIVRLLRTLRVTRALRVVRVFRFFKELRMMCFSVLRSGTSLVWSVVLVFMDVFLFSVYLTQQVAAFQREDRAEPQLQEAVTELFGSMPRAFYTLFLSVSGGISWVEVSTPLLQIHWSNGLVFVFFIFFTMYALTNIITGVFVDTAIQSAASDRDEVIQTQLHDRDSTLQQMRELFLEADVDDSGFVTLQELELHLSDKRVRAHMASLGLHLDEARGLFRLLDMDKSGALTIDEYIFGCMRLKGSARSIDLATLMYENKRMFGILASFFDFVEAEFLSLHARLLPQQLPQMGARASGKGSGTAVSSEPSWTCQAKARARSPSPVQGRRCRQEI